MDYVIINLLIICIHFHNNPSILLWISANIFNLLIRLAPQKFKTPLYGFLLVLSVLFPKSVPFLPIIFVDCPHPTLYGFGLLIAIVQKDIITFVLILFALYITHKNHVAQIQRETLIDARDFMRKRFFDLMDRNKKFEDESIHIQELATLNERNRISGELHDSIGHTISSSILQVKALSIVSKDQKVQQGLNLLKDNLESGMIEIRRTLHHLHRSSFLMENKIRELIEKLPEVKTNLNYRLESPLSQEMKYDVLRVVKEGISNFIKHSDGNKLRIDLLENKNFIIISIADNGQSVPEKNHLGMGLYSIQELAEKYHGFMNIYTEHGYKLHVVFRRTS